MTRPPIVRRLVSLLLAVLVLTASVGLTVQRYTCRLSGQSTTAFLVAAAGTTESCGEQLPTTSKAHNRCCDISSYFHKLSTPAHELAPKIVVPNPAVALWLPATIGLLKRAAAQEAASRNPSWYAADGPPPPLSGRERLALACKLDV